jgi:hypothetical protein
VSGPRRLHALAIVALLACAGCIEDRLSVEITTQVHLDGSCSRRTEYRLERIDTNGERRLAIPEAEDPLRRLHRFPDGVAWQRTAAVDGEIRSLVTEATLASPNAIEWDYWRAAAPRAHPARNHVSFSHSTEEGAEIDDYAEVFSDPSSPLAAARHVARVLSRQDDDFAKALERSLGRRLRRNDLKRAFREHCAAPFARGVAALAARPLFGPRERKDLEALFEEAACAEGIAASVAAADPSIAPETEQQAFDKAFDALGPSIEKEMAAVGLPLAAAFPEMQEPRPHIHFRVTLVMPGPIVRANTCFQGDTATWEFDAEDLFGRGFEMRAKSVSR